MADTDTNVTALRPKRKDATGAERRRRFRKKRKARLPAPMMPTVTVATSVTPAERNGAVTAASRH